MQDNDLAIDSHTTALKACISSSLKPILDRSIAGIVGSSPATLREWVGKYGSPLNIVWPHILRQNVDSMRAVLHRHGMRFEIFYGAKVNKSQALVRAAVEADAGVDVSSLYELRDALRAGAGGSRICATGPAKTRAFHDELVAGGALISIDSTEELNALNDCVQAGASTRKARVLLRYRPAAFSKSRFGMGAEELQACLRRLGRCRDSFAFEGFHFHLGDYAYESRAQALRELTVHINAARALRLGCRMVDIGGGLPIRYVDSDEYETYLQSQCGAHYRNGKLPANFYPYGSRIDACEWLDRLLQAPCVGGLNVAQYFDAMDLTMAIEPGRSLADQAAISLFRITRVKPLEGGVHVIFVEGSSFSACETWFASEFLVDPILISGELSTDIPAMPCRAYIAGHSCLDDDVITNRLINFSRMPGAGDLLVYANTAGYQMDLLENEFHRHPMPRRVAASHNAAGGMDISPDDQKEQ